jgi:hypothetical protein
MNTEKILLEKVVDLYNEVYNFLDNKNIFKEKRAAGRIEGDKRELAEGIHKIQDILIRSRLKEVDPDFFE